MRASLLIVNGGFIETSPISSNENHSAIRRHVMGDEASERRATESEIEAMKELVRDGMREGAIGFSTSHVDLHVGEDGREVPSNHASAEEVIALAGVLSEFAIRHGDPISLGPSSRAGL